MLGGVAVAENISAIAHSDGDVVIHALVDAILGAIGAGDIGQMFPDTDSRWKNAASRVFLESALDRAADLGWRLGNADVTILAERPRLGAHKATMSALLSEILGAPVNIKAGTNESCDAVGRGEAVAAHAVVLLVRDLK